MSAFIATSLIAGLWESAIVAFATWLIVRVCFTYNAAARYVAWGFATISCIALALASARVQMTAASATRTPIAIDVMHGLRSGTTLSSYTLDARPELMVDDRAAYLLILLWSAFAGLFIIRLLIEVMKLERLKRTALPLPLEYRTLLSRWPAIPKGNRDVRVCTSTQLDVPTAIGLFDAMIVIPQSFLTLLAPPELDCIILHELAHLRRGDDWLNLIQRTIGALFFFNPAIIYLLRQLDLEREAACDDAVIAGADDATPYAGTLITIARATRWSRRFVLAPGVFSARRALSVRIERLLDATARPSHHPVLWALAGTLAAAIGCLAAASTISPVIAYASSGTNAMSAPLAAGESATARAELLRIVRGLQAGTLTPREMGAEIATAHDRSVMIGISATMSELGPAFGIKYLRAEPYARGSIYKYLVTYRHNRVLYNIFHDPRGRIDGVSFQLDPPGAT